ncbi:MAG: recombination mediator RecR [Candidatus Omnitrophica bacterium]|nr:recombination mediator RecR [Candidatus Omnitrophota bacterium]MCM8809786.1 recombination mediator RecR [Candidatus Omnitrophota bacterium]MCM8810035.1 recombination mediator RecR [Candidatus Omnitrophota bacterium]
MGLYPEIIEKLIEKLKKLPGVGPKSAERIIYYLIHSSEDEVVSLGETFISLKKQVKLCKKCFNFAEKDLCNICLDDKRENIICVVEEVKDLISIEKTNFKGRYHVLWGKISMLENTTPEQLKIPQLIDRIKNEKIEEIIIATNPTIEGENTATYISQLLKKIGVKHSRLAIGLPLGSELEYIDSHTLKKAIEGRKEL